MVLKGQSEEVMDCREQKQDPFPPPHTEQIYGIKGTVGGGGGVGVGLRGAEDSIKGTVGRGGGVGLRGTEAGPVSTSAH